MKHRWIPIARGMFASGSARGEPASVILLSSSSRRWYPYIVGMPLDTYRLWKRNNQDVGCVFARYMATKPAEFGQRAVVISGRKADAVATQIASKVTEFVE